MEKAAKLKEEASGHFKDCILPYAIQKFTECLQVDPLNSDFNSKVLLNLAICSSKKSDYKSAISSLDKAIKLKPNYAKALVKRGKCIWLRRTIRKLLMTLIRLLSLMRLDLMLLIT